MKQPELGNKIAEARNQKGWTQIELAEKCNINIRSIQRIETGEVNPRNSTLRLISEVLGMNNSVLFDTNPDPSDLDPRILKTTVLCGIGVLLCNLSLIVLIFFRDIIHTGYQFTHINTLVLIFIIVFLILFNRGIVHLGKHYNNQFLVVTGFAGMVFVFFGNILTIVQMYSPMPIFGFIAKTFMVLQAMNGIFYAIGLIMLKDKLGDLAIVAGALLIITSLMQFVPIGIIQYLGLFIAIPLLLVQTIIFYKEQKNTNLAFEL